MIIQRLLRNKYWLAVITMLPTILLILMGVLFSLHTAPVQPVNLYLTLSSYGDTSRHIPASSSAESLGNSGILNWNVQTPGPLVLDGVDTRAGIAYYDNADATLSVLRTSYGETLWHSDSAHSFAASGDGRVYLYGIYSETDITVEARRAADGKLLWSREGSLMVAFTPRSPRPMV